MRQPVRVKVCGITRMDDALKAVEFGVDAVGFIFFRESPRYISPEDAGKIISELPPFVATVGVFVNESSAVISAVRDIAGIDTIQLHGDEPDDLCSLWPRVIKAFRVKDFKDIEPLKRYNVSAYLLDTYSRESFGGTGQVFDWDIAVEAGKFGPVILSGGLTPDNIGDAVRQVRPFAVDVSSGVEAEKGLKDADKVRAFIQKAKSALS